MTSIHKPSKQRRLVRSQDCGPVHRRSSFSLFHDILISERDTQSEVASSAFSMNWSQLHDHYILPLLEGSSLDVSGLEKSDIIHLHGFLIVVLTAVASVVETGSLREDDTAEIYQNVFVIIHLLEQIYGRQASVITESREYLFNVLGEGAVEAFSTILRLVTVLDRYSRRNTKLNESFRCYFHDASAALLLKLGSLSILSFVKGSDRRENEDVDEVIRAWCLSIVGLVQKSHPMTTSFHSQHHHLYRQLINDLVHTYGAKNMTIHTRGLEYLTVTCRAIEDSCFMSQSTAGTAVIDSFECMCCILLRNHHSRVLSFEPAVYTNLLHHLCDVIVKPSRSLTKCQKRREREEASACLCLLVLHNLNPMESTTATPLGTESYKTLTQALINTADDIDSASWIVRGLDAWKNPLCMFSVLDAYSSELWRGMIKTLVRVAVQDVTSTPTSSLVESLAIDCNDKFTTAAAASTRVLVILLERILHLQKNIQSNQPLCDQSTEKEDDIKTPITPGTSSSAFPSPFVPDISLMDMMDICLVLMNSRDEHVVATIVTFVYQQFQQPSLSETQYNSLLKLLPVLAIVVKRWASSASGLLLKKQVLEVWKHLCSSSSSSSRNWVGYHLVRDSHVLDILIKTCHDDSPVGTMAMQIILVLTNDPANYRILVKHSGFLPNLIRRVRAASLPDDTAGTKSLDNSSSVTEFVDHGLLQQRLFLLAHVM